MLSLKKILLKIENFINPLVRDFTMDAEEEMVAIANDVNDSDNLFAKYITDPVGRWLDKEGYLDLICGVDKYRECVIDYYNYSAENIRKICSQARNLDATCGQTVALCADQSENVVFLVKNLAECINPNSTNYGDEPISQRLFEYFNREFDGETVKVVAAEADKLNDNSLKKVDVSEEDVVDFCNDTDSQQLFEEYTDYIYDEEMDWGALDIVFLSTGSVVYKGVEMTITELLSVISKEGYSDKIVREQLNLIISSVISANSSTQTFMKEYDMAKEVVENRIKQYLDDEDNDSSFKSFVEAMGGITAVKELAKECPQLLDYLISDYTKGLEIINEIAKTCENSGCSEMRKAIERLSEEYQSKWCGLLHKTADFSENMVSELSKEAIKDWIKDEVGDTSVLLKVLDIADVEDKVDGSHKLLALRKITYELQDSYEDVIKKINSGNYTDEDLTGAKNMFDMLKETTKSIYETYRDTLCDDPSKKIWLNDQIENIENMSMRHYSTYKFEIY